LALRGRLEPHHDPFSPPYREMGVFGPIVQPFMRTMLNAGYDIAFGGIVGPEFVCDHHAGREALAFEQLAHQFQRCLFVATALQKGFKHIAFSIDGTPEPVFPALDCYHQTNGAGEFHPPLS
jgi:hypothetical protein